MLARPRILQHIGMTATVLPADTQAIELICFSAEAYTTFDAVDDGPKGGGGGGLQISSAVLRYSWLLP